jgi:hypothetical protein
MTLQVNDHVALEETSPIKKSGDDLVVLAQYSIHRRNEESNLVPSN